MLGSRAVDGERNVEVLLKATCPRARVGTIYQRVLRQPANFQSHFSYHMAAQSDSFIRTATLCSDGADFFQACERGCGIKKQRFDVG